MNSEQAAKINAITEPIGGLAVARRLLSADALEYIANFPGKILTVTAWSYSELGYDADLRALGYEPGQKYQVLDQKGQKLYSGYNSTGILGETAVERALVNQSPNGSFYHIKLIGKLRDSLALLWVFNEFSPQAIELNLEFLREKERQRLLPNLGFSELYLQTEGLESNASVDVHILEGRYQTALSPEEIINSSETKVLRGRAGEQIRIRFSQDVWFAILVNNQLARLDNIQGGIAEKLRSNPTGSYHFSSLNRAQLRPRPGQTNVSSFTTTTFADVSVTQVVVRANSSIQTVIPTIYQEPLTLQAQVVISNYSAPARSSLKASQRQRLEIVAPAGSVTAEIL